MAKAKFNEEAVRMGLLELERLGVAIDDLSPALVPRLAELAGAAKPASLAAVFLLGKIADPGAADVLAALEAGTTDRELAKEIKRSLFKLSQRGLAVARERPAAVAALPLFNRAPEIEAYMSPVDGSGGRLVWIVRPYPNKGVQVLQAMVSDREGLQRAGGAQIPRKELRRMAQEIKDSHGLMMIAVPWEYADSVLSGAYEQARSRGRTGLENFQQLRAAVTTHRPETPEHPIYGKLQASEAREGAWRERSRVVLEEPELRFWILDHDWMEPFLAALGEAQTSRLVLNPAQKEERLAAIVRDAVGEICAGEKGAIFRRRMEDMALYFLETARPQSAKLAFAVALQIGEGGPGPLDIAFLTGLVQKSFAFYLSQQQNKADEEPSLIVKP